MKVGSQSKTNPSFSTATGPYSETLMNYYSNRIVCFSIFVNIYCHSDEKKERKMLCEIWRKIYSTKGVSRKERTINKTIKYLNSC